MLLCLGEREPICDPKAVREHNHAVALEPLTVVDPMVDYCNGRYARRTSRHAGLVFDIARPSSPAEQHRCTAQQCIEVVRGNGNTQLIGDATRRTSRVDSNVACYALQAMQDDIGSSCIVTDDGER